MGASLTITFIVFIDLNPLMQCNHLMYCVPYLFSLTSSSYSLEKSFKIDVRLEKYLNLIFP